MSSFETPPDQPIVGDCGIPVPVTASQDPYRTLDDLMAVVEALCPRWPMRGTFAGADEMLL